MRVLAEVPILYTQHLRLRYMRTVEKGEFPWESIFEAMRGKPYNTNFILSNGKAYRKVPQLTRACGFIEQWVSRS